MPYLDIVHNPENTIIYCAPRPFTPKEDVVFENHHLAEQNAGLPNHLTIPRFVKECHQHITLIYIPENYHEAQRNFIVVHLNCTFQAILSPITAYSFPYHPTFHRANEGGQKIIMDNHQQEAALSVADELFETYRTIFSEKAKAYIDLYQLSFVVDHHLASLRAQQAEPELIRTKAVELRDISQKLTLYHGSKRDGRMDIMTQLLDSLTVVEKAPLKDSSVPNNLEEKKEDILGVVPYSQSNKNTYLLRHKDVLQTTKNQIQAQIATLISLTSSPLTAAYVQEWLQLEMLFTELHLIAHSDENEEIINYIADQRSQLAIHVSLLDYFSACIQSGDVDAVKLIFPVLDGRYDLSPQFFALIRDMINKFDNPLIYDEWPKMGEFFYEQSECFRSLLLLSARNMMIVCDDNLMEGLAFRCFITKNLPAFLLVLKVVRPDTPQLLAQDGVHYLGLLGAIINHYRDNPDIEFIQALLPLFSGINLPKISMQNLTVDREIFNNSRAFKNLTNNIAQQFASLPNSTKPMPDALILSSILKYEIYPELIHELAPYASVKSLLYVLAKFANLPYIESHFLIGTQPMINFVPDNESANRLTFRIGSKSPEAAKYCVFLFYPNGSADSSKAQKTFASLQAILDSFYAFLEREADNIEGRDAFLRQLMHNFAANKSNLNTCLAAQFCYTFILKPSMTDHQAMLRLFALTGTRLKELSQPTDNLYTVKMCSFLNMFSENQLECLGRTPVYDFAIKKLPPAYQERFLKYIPPKKENEAERKHVNTMK